MLYGSDNLIANAFYGCRVRFWRFITNCSLASTLSSLPDPVAHSGFGHLT